MISRLTLYALLLSCLARGQVVTILGTDTISSSRSVINGNFSYLNTAKLETASNVGSLGVGIFKTKSGTDLQFYKAYSANNLLTVALSGTDFLQFTVNTANFPLASGAQFGFLSAADWTTFNSKYGSGSSPSFTAVTVSGNITRTGMADGCAQFVAGVFTSIGAPCGTSTGGEANVTADVGGGLSLRGATPKSGVTLNLRTLAVTSPMTMTQVADLITFAIPAYQPLTTNLTNLGALTPTDDTIIVYNGSVPQSKTLPNCTDTAGNHLNYDLATNVFSCGNSGGSGSGASGTLAAMPGSCSGVTTYVATDQPKGEQNYQCYGGTFFAQHYVGGAGGTITADNANKTLIVTAGKFGGIAAANVWTALNSFATIKMPIASGTLPGAECASAADYGRLYVKGDATSGQRLYVCESGGWTLQGGTGSGSGTVTHTLGALTADQPMFGNGTADSKVGTKTGTGTEAVMSGSPTIVTPTIASFANAAHNHTNAAGGAQLTDAALSAAVTVAKGGTGVTTLPTGVPLVGAGTSAVVSSTAVPICSKYTVTAATVVAGATTTTSDVTLFTLPAQGKIQGVTMKQSATFAGTGITNMTVSVGLSGNTTAYSSAYQLITLSAGVAPGATIMQDDGGHYSASFASHAVIARFTSAGANLSVLSTGTLDVWACTVVLP